MLGLHVKISDGQRGTIGHNEISDTKAKKQIVRQQACEITGTASFAFCHYPAHQGSGACSRLHRTKPNFIAISQTWGGNVELVHLHTKN
jgi:hypothetical protein